MSVKLDPSRSFLPQLRRKNCSFLSWKNDRLEINDNFSISIQAGSEFYSQPKKDLPLNEEYSQFEIALFVNKNNCWEFFSPKRYFPDLHWVSYFDEIDSPVAGYLSISEIDGIIKDVIRFGKLINFV